MEITSDEVNYLIYKYFVDEGNSAACELLNQDHKYDDSPPSCQTSLGLVELILKGLQLNQLEVSAESNQLDGFSGLDSPMDGVNTGFADPVKLEQALKHGNASTSSNGTHMGDDDSAVRSDDSQAGSPGELSVAKSIEAVTLPGALVLSTSKELASFGYESGDVGLYDSSNFVSTLSNGTTAGGANVTAIAWSQRGDKVAVGSLSGSIRIWQKDCTLKAAVECDGHSPILYICWSANEAYLMSLNCLNSLTVWDTTTWKSVVVCLPNPLNANTMADATWIDNKNFAISNGLTIAIQKVTEQSPHAWFNGHVSPIEKISFDMTSQLLASGDESGEIMVWHGKSQSPIKSLSGHSSMVTSLVWVPAPVDAMIRSEILSHLISAGTDGMIICWDLFTASKLTVVDVGSPVLDLKLDSTKTFLAVLADNVSIYKLAADCSKLKLLYTNKSSSRLTSLSWSDDGVLYAAGSAQSYAIQVKH